MKILVLNPNGSREITETIAQSVRSLQARTTHRIEFDYIQSAPKGIESDDDVAFVSPLVADIVGVGKGDAYVVACFSDPGVIAARGRTDRPVIGIAEAAYYAALQCAPRFGVVSLGQASIARHAAHIDRLGLSARLAGDRSIEMSVKEANDPAGAKARVVETATRLRDDGAGVVILGCAGMGVHRAALQRELGMTVIDPVQAAVTAAITALDLDYKTKG